MTTVDVQQAWGSLRRLGRTGRRSRARAVPVELAPSLAVARAIAFTAGLLAAWAVLYGIVLSGLQEHRAQHNLFAAFREQLSTATAPTRAPIALGRPVAVVDIPSLGIHRLVVVEGTGAEQLRSGPGHRPDSVLPGQAGASVLFGRSTTFGAPFRRVPDLTAGATIVVTTGQGHFLYTVTGTRHPGDPLPAPLAAGRSALTLVTSSSRYGGLGG
ncbi:MAG: class E sortase, partial [Frankiales bacterium]|nr:class E sortase [Frankiales bacterium]